MSSLRELIPETEQEGNEDMAVVEWAPATEVVVAVAAVVVVVVSVMAVAAAAVE